VIVRGEGVPGRVARLLANQQLVVQARPQTPSSPSFEPPARELPASPPSNISPERANSGESDTAQIVTSPAGAPTVPSVSREPSLVRPPLRRVRRPDAQPSAPPAASPNSIALALQHADRLRELGDPAAAAEQLEDALLAHPKDAAAGLVEFTLGRLYLDRLGEPTRAARAFAAVLSRGAPQPLLEDALARYCEALWKAGQREAARAEFSKYQRTYPRGSRRAALAVLLAPP
jgi:TolA-binding protein